MWLNILTIFFYLSIFSQCKPQEDENPVFVGNFMGQKRVSVLSGVKS